jgi:Bifunctional DNA primase/polymerase, N-terminal
MSCGCLHYDGGYPLVQQYGLGAAAIRYQAQGYSVLPLAGGGKKPHRMLPWDGQGRDGVYHASPHPEQVMEWWKQDKTANVGVATGRVSQLVVIDLDVKAGQDGPREFSRFLSTQMPGVLLGCPWVNTPSGGRHIWLRTPPGQLVPERPGILPGVDIKGDGGFVVAPPSMLLVPAPDRPGEPKGGQAAVPYTWAAGCPCTVPEMPSWMMHWLATAPSTGNTSKPNDADVPELEAAKAHGLPAGERNAGMHKLACSLFRLRGVGIEASVKTKEDLMEVWQNGDRTGFPPGEVLTIIDSARRFIAAELEAEQAQRDSYIASTGGQRIDLPPIERGQGLTEQQRESWKE